jgi:hypothetical protein
MAQLLYLLGTGTDARLRTDIIALATIKNTPSVSLHPARLWVNSAG